VYGVTHHGRGAGLEWDDVDGAEIRRQPQRQTIFGAQYAITNSRSVLRTRVSGLGAFEGRSLLASAPNAGMRAVLRKKGTPLLGTAPHGARWKKAFDGKRMFIVERNFSPSDRLLHFARANLPQGGRRCAAHVAAGIPALQLLQHANHAFHGLVLFRLSMLH